MKKKKSKKVFLIALLATCFAAAAYLTMSYIRWGTLNTTSVDWGTAFKTDGYTHAAQCYLLFPDGSPVEETVSEVFVSSKAGDFCLDQLKIGNYEMGIIDTPEERWGYLAAARAQKVPLEKDHEYDDEVTATKNELMGWVFSSHRKAHCRLYSDAEDLEKVVVFSEGDVEGALFFKDGDLVRYEVYMPCEEENLRGFYRCYRVVVSECRSLSFPSNWGDFEFSPMSENDFAKATAYFLTGAEAYTATGTELTE